MTEVKIVIVIRVVSLKRIIIIITEGKELHKAHIRKENVQQLPLNQVPLRRIPREEMCGGALEQRR